MAKEKEPSSAGANKGKDGVSNDNSERKHKKLPRLEKHQRISKRPLLHPPIASPYTSPSTQKVIYVSASSPFIATIKRVQKLLTQIQNRQSSSQAFALKGNGKGGGKGGNVQAGKGEEELRHLMKKGEKEFLKGVEESIGGSRSGGNGGKERESEREEVILKGTGKAIERVLRLAVWFQNEGQTGNDGDGDGEGDGKYIVRVRTGSVGAVDDVVGKIKGENNEGGENEEGRGEVEGSRVRWVSCLEVGVSLR